MIKVSGKYYYFERSGDKKPDLSKRVKKDHKKLFTIAEGSGIISEAPHIQVGDQVIDLEFERDKTEGLRKIIRAIVRQEITDKYGNRFRLRSSSEVEEFISVIMRNAQVKRLIG